MKKFPDLGQVSRTTVISSLKSDHNMSYKQLHRRPRQTFSKLSERAFAVAMNIQKQLEDKGFELLYIDEFSVSDRSFKAYGWSKRGGPGWLSGFPDSFSMSFFLAFSRNQFYGIMGNEETSNSRKFIYFLKKVLKFRNHKPNLNSKRLVIVLDNASIHKSDEVVKFISKLSLTVLTIPPYEPSLNSVEKFILAIKMKLRKLRWQDRYLNTF